MSSHVSRPAAAGELLARRKARESLLDFTTYTKPDYQVSWHHRALCEALDRFVAGETTRLMVSLPPRHGKSELVSRRLPAYLLGKDPDMSVIACSYSADLASMMNRDVQRIMDGPEYLRVFPETRLFGSNVRTVAQGAYLRNSDIFEIVGNSGIYRSAGVGGGITGMGCNCLYGNTPIITHEGTKSIASIVRSGRPCKVLAFNTRTKTAEWRRVTAVRETRSSRLLEIKTVGGRSILATAEHRFFVPERGYTEAHRLLPGDRLIAAGRVEPEIDMPGVRGTQRKENRNVQPVLSETSESDGGDKMRLLRGRVRSPPIRVSEVTEEGPCRHVLLTGLLKPAPCRKTRTPLRELRETHAEGTRAQVLQPRMSEGCNVHYPEAAKNVPEMPNRICPDNCKAAVLFESMCRCRSRTTDDRDKQPQLQGRDELLGIFSPDPRSCIGARRKAVHGVRGRRIPGSDHAARGGNDSNQPRGTSYQRGPGGQPPGESDHTLQDVPRNTPQVHIDTVAVVRSICGESVPVYDLQVEGTSNFFAGEILVHNCGIIDDPIKNQEEANSPTYREKLWEWYTTTFYTRLEKDARVLVTMTRWHENDLAGRLIEAAKDEGSDQWEIVKFPAIAEPGNPIDPRPEGAPLWPEKYSIERLNQMKATLGAYPWAALYQQAPAPAGGGLFKRDWFQYFDVDGADYILHSPRGDLRVSSDNCTVFQTCDPAGSTKTSADYFALGTWAVTPTQDTLLLDVVHRRLEGPDQPALFRESFQQWNPSVQGVEARNTGLTLFQQLKRDGLPVVELKPDSDKFTRALPMAARYESGCVYHLANAPWLVDYELELVGFPGAAHDDQVDMAAYAYVLQQQFCFNGVAIESPIADDRLSVPSFGSDWSDSIPGF